MAIAYLLKIKIYLRILIILWSLKKVAQNTLRLPMSLSKGYNIDQTIEELERYNNSYLSQWRNSSWLKGALGIILMKTMSLFSMGLNSYMIKNMGLQRRG